MKVVCMCWCTFMIRQRHVCVHVHVAIRRHSSNSSNSMHLFWDSVFHWPGSHITDYAPWPVSPRDPPASAYPAPGWQVEASMPAFLFLFHFFFLKICVLRIGLKFSSFPDDPFPVWAFSPACQLYLWDWTLSQDPGEFTPAERAPEEAF